MFRQLNQINTRPKPFEFYTVKELWADEHTSKQMLKYHLDGSVDISSYKFSFIDRSVNWIESYFSLSPETKIADFGCGPGLYTTRLAEKGAKVTGIDFSKNSLEYAKQQAQKKFLDITYINKNYLEYHPQKKYDLIIMIMRDFCVLSPAQRKLLLEIFYTALNPKGNVLLDVDSISAFNKKKETASYTKNQNGLWSDNEYYEFHNLYKYDDERVTVDKLTVIEETRTFTVYNWFQYFSQESLGKEFEDAGFQVQEYFDDVAGTAFSSKGDKFAIVSKKK